MAQTATPSPEPGATANPTEAAPVTVVPDGLTASLSQVLANKANQFRQNDFEVYRWASDPSVIILDFRTLAIQDLYVKRLVFFLEKAGYRGQILSDAQMQGQHGWNANDFSPESLARFYNAARKAAFALNPSEEYFLQCLLAWGLLTQDEQDFSAGTGAIVSIAQDMAAYTRRTLLQHEMTHGIYFTSKEFRDFVAVQWKALPAEPKSFLIRFFQFKRYDTSDAALMVNEFQAYLLQQPLGALDDYVTKSMPGQFVLVYPKDTEFAARAQANAPVLHAAAKTLSDWLKQKLGINIADLTR
jgi:hypothetical protein